MSDATGELTPAMVRRYIDGDGARCPFCGSEDLEAGSHLEADGGSATGDVSCLACDKHWRDVYTLCEVDIQDDQGRYKARIGPAHGEPKPGIGNA